MFPDYYAILQVSPDASFEEIKKAYRKQASIWHPDKNPNRDTHEQMLRINEAFVILRDAEARAKYDEAYRRYKAHGSASTVSSEASGQDVEVDAALKEWMRKARTKATELNEVSLDDILGMTAEAAKTFVATSVRMGGIYLGVSVAVTLLFAVLGAETAVTIIALGFAGILCTGTFLLLRRFFFFFFNRKR